MSLSTILHTRPVHSLLVAAVAASILGAVPAHAANGATSRVDVTAFQAAGDVGGGVLTPGDTFPPTTSSNATLQRKADRLKARIHTTGLPAGAYTVWWVIFNNPAACDGPCDTPDLFNPDTQSAVFLASNGVVGGDGRGAFRAEHKLGDPRGEPGQQDIINNGYFDPLNAQVLNVIKYHGPASADPELLHRQLTTLSGSCESGANALETPIGVQCFDPQIAFYPTPGTT